MDNPTVKQEVKQRQQKGSMTEVLTPNKTPSWRYGIAIAFFVVVLPLAIAAGFYFGLINI